MRGHDDQQLAQAGLSQQAVLLWHSWGESMPSTWLEPWGELADGIDARVYFLIYWACLSLSLGEREYWNKEGASQVRKGGSAKKVGQRDSVGLVGERLPRSQCAPGRQMFELIWVYKSRLCCWIKELLMSTISVPFSSQSLCYYFPAENEGCTHNYNLFNSFLWK